MSIDEFWKLIDDAHHQSGGCMDTKADLLAAALQKLSTAEVRDFDRHFDDLMRQSHDARLWAAAYVIQSGCGCDGFMDFRQALISLGRKRFEEALKNPDSLADLSETDVEALYTEMWGNFIGDLTEYDLSTYVPPPYVHETLGKGVSDDQLETEFPRLTARFR